MWTLTLIVFYVHTKKKKEYLSWRKAFWEYNKCVIKKLCSLFKINNQFYFIEM